MKIISWNINSLRLRLPLVEKLVQMVQPDVLCLQETKVEDGLFPELALRAMGFTDFAFSGQKSYNGVAILSRLPLSGVEIIDILQNEEKRHISAVLPNGVRISNFYVPAGGDIPDVVENKKFADKLQFLATMQDWSENKQEKNILLGDLNIAPLENDVWSHKQLLAVVSHTPIEVENLNKLQKISGWVDSARHFVPENEKLYSWWSYRNKDWEKSNRGRRLDHIWVTPDLQKNLRICQTLREVRNWNSPSDHVPVLLEIE